jgi:hypothetical protein
VAVPNYFLIQQGIIRAGRVELERHPTSGLRLRFR